jgi:hypothetical protein
MRLRLVFLLYPFTFARGRHHILIMLTLSKHDQVIITKYPLDGSLESLRDKLCETAKTPYADAATSQRTTSRLLAALMGHESAYHLESKNGQENLAAELLKAMNRIHTFPFNYDYFRSLLLLVIDQRPDADI